MTECGSVRRLPLAFAAAVALSGATAPAMAAVPDTTVPVSATHRRDTDRPHHHGPAHRRRRGLDIGRR